ncbi:MAG: translesion error-prone DNA polymerase V autoproteolytic subunit [Bacteroidales bacterium]|nr:translesion error-prone DNA polymerase V autoproteolytic subunit [Bacteroidales bacterium]
MYSASSEAACEFPFVETIAAGFPSPADDFAEMPLDIAKLLIRNPSATFFARVAGNSMQDAGIGDGDILVIDRSLSPAEGRIAVCFLDGEFTVKRLHFEKDICYLMPAHSDYPPIMVTADNDFIIWGIVTYVIKSVL